MINQAQRALAATSSVPVLPFQPVGATIEAGGVTYRTWAPDHRLARVVIGGNGQPKRFLDLERDENGFFSAHDPSGRAGDYYRYFFDERTLTPDVASRYQPFGVFGPSQVINPDAYDWKTTDWVRPPYRGRVIYELHVGTFTPAGTFLSAISRLEHLARLGVNAIELMPLADFPGRCNWGYDGVMPFAPARCYGHPHDLRAFIDAAHAHGIAVMLDVVYNHFGPCGNHFALFTDRYFHPTRLNHWGRSINVDGEHSRHVRDYFVQNALYWLDEFKIDGLRLDATHAVEDSSEQHFFAEIATAVHSRGAFAVAEDERNETAIICSEAEGEGGWGLDGVWADDFHHTIRVALTGQKESHFKSFTGAPEEWVATLMHGWFYRGQYYSHWKRERGKPCDHLPPERFIVCLSNHDQVGNRALGDRLNHIISPERYRAVSTLLCLTPFTPMLFMGQEWSADSPFLFFTDMPGELGATIGQSRRDEFRKYGTNADPKILSQMPDPQDEATFQDSKLKWDELSRPPNAGVFELYRECLGLRAREPVFRNPLRDMWTAKKIGEHLVTIRWRHPAGDWLLLLTLYAAHLERWRAEEHLVPHDGKRWSSVLHSNDRRFGGTVDAPRILEAESVALPNGAAWLLREQ